MLLLQILKGNSYLRLALTIELTIMSESSPKHETSMKGASPLETEFGQKVHLVEIGHLIPTIDIDATVQNFFVKNVQKKRREAEDAGEDAGFERFVANLDVVSDQKNKDDEETKRLLRIRRQQLIHEEVIRLRDRESSIFSSWNENPSKIEDKSDAQETRFKLWQAWDTAQKELKRFQILNPISQFNQYRQKYLQLAHEVINAKVAYQQSLLPVAKSRVDAGEVLVFTRRELLKLLFGVSLVFLLKNSIGPAEAILPNIEKYRHELGINKIREMDERGMVSYFVSSSSELKDVIDDINNGVEGANGYEIKLKSNTEFEIAPHEVTVEDRHLENPEKFETNVCIEINTNKPVKISGPDEKQHPILKVNERETDIGLYVRGTPKVTIKNVDIKICSDDEEPTGRVKKLMDRPVKLRSGIYIDGNGSSQETSIIEDVKVTSEFITGESTIIGVPGEVGQVEFCGIVMKNLGPINCTRITVKDAYHDGLAFFATGDVKVKETIVAREGSPFNNRVGSGIGFIGPTEDVEVLPSLEIHKSEIVNYIKPIPVVRAGILTCSRVNFVRIKSPNPDCENAPMMYLISGNCESLKMTECTSSGVGSTQLLRFASGTPIICKECSFITRPLGMQWSRDLRRRDIKEFNDQPVLARPGEYDFYRKFTSIIGNTTIYDPHTTNDPNGHISPEERAFLEEIGFNIIDSL